MLILKEIIIVIFEYDNDTINKLQEKNG